MAQEAAQEAARRAADRQLYATVVRSARGGGGKVTPPYTPFANLHTKQTGGEGVKMTSSPLGALEPHGVPAAAARGRAQPPATQPFSPTPAYLLYTIAKEIYRVVHE